jgi:argininosuccinate lyase
MKAMTQQGFLTATDLADELVRRGVRFAQAHEQVGKLVHHCAERGKTFADLSTDEARRFIPSWDARLHTTAVSPDVAVQRKNVIGGTSPSQCARQLRAAEARVKQMERHFAG